MKGMTARDFDNGLLDLCGHHAHGTMTKREFLDGSVEWAVGGETAAALVEMPSRDRALARQAPLNDPGITAQHVTCALPNGHGEVRGQPVRPADAAATVRAVPVVHGNRGLNHHIDDIPRRLARSGFMSPAPDWLTSFGRCPGKDSDGRELRRTVDRAKLMNDFFAGLEHLMERCDSTGKFGCVGFRCCGVVRNALAVACPEPSASVPSCGRHAAVADVPGIKAPLLLHFGELDRRTNAGWPEYEAAPIEHGKVHEARSYPGPITVSTVIRRHAAMKRRQNSPGTARWPGSMTTLNDCPAARHRSGGGRADHSLTTRVGETIAVNGSSRPIVETTGCAGGTWQAQP